MRLLHPVAFTRERGGEWHDWWQGPLMDVDLAEAGHSTHELRRLPTLRGITCYALRFADGAEWDVVHGWRPPPPTDTRDTHDTQVATLIRFLEDVLDALKTLQITRRP